MSLATVADLDARRIGYEDAAQATAAVDDVSARMRVCVAPLLDDVDAPDQQQPAVDQDVPAAVVAIAVGVVRRELTNPRALSQESLGDYAYSTGGPAVASGYLTRREKQMLRRAVGKLGAASVGTVGDLPLQRSEWDTIIEG